MSEFQERMWNKMRFGLPLAFVILLLFSSCKDTISAKKTSHVYNSIALREIEVEGCQYFIYRSSITHKGNCSNPIHNK